jgi:hypothetical protein
MVAYEAAKHERRILISGRTGAIPCCQRPSPTSTAVCERGRKPVIPAEQRIRQRRQATLPPRCECVPICGGESDFSGIYFVLEDGVGDGVRGREPSRMAPEFVPVIAQRASECRHATVQRIRRHGIPRVSEEDSEEIANGTLSSNVSGKCPTEAAMRLNSRMDPLRSRRRHRHRSRLQRTLRLR